MQDKTKEEILRILKTSKEGLSSEEALRRLKNDGKNELKEKKEKSLLKMFAGQLKDKMIIILLIASVLSFILGETAEGVVILIIVLINAFISVWEEKKATDALKALQKLNASLAKVIRDGKNKKILTNELVKGDIVLLEAGDIVPADLRLLEENQLKIDESSLTGESVPVSKDDSFLADSDISIADQKNMAFSSTLVSYGTGIGVVVGTGMSTEVGKIASMLQDTKTLDSPLKRKLNKVGTTLSIVGILVSILIFLIGFLNGRDFISLVMISVSLAISVIPEGLPATATVVMALGVERMAKKKALVKTLPAVEALGSATVICTDKTGTLTENKMTVTSYFLAEDLLEEKDSMQMNKDMFYAMILCNNASLEQEKIIGDPTEGALLLFAKKHKIDLEQILKNSPKLFEQPFDSVRKRMSSVHEINNQLYVFSKGAPEELLEKCSKVQIKDHERNFWENEKDIIRKRVAYFSSKGIRLLGFAKRKIDHIPVDEQENVEEELTFLGIVGMIDPPRKEAYDAISLCHTAGIRVIMITGDHKLTATAIAKDLGIYKDGDDVVDGIELQNMSDEELEKRISNISVFARVSPEDKLKIVKALQKNGEIVAMTGDGVNDSPALKTADIGVSMGCIGTDVAKDASDMILLDDNFATITVAVREGRRVYRNIEKVIQFLLAGNIAEVLVIFLAMVLNLETPLMAVHILFVNLVTDTFPSLALGIDPENPDSMRKKPRRTKSLFQKGLVFRVIFYGVYIAAITLFAYSIGLKQGYNIALTMAFMVLCLSQIFHSFNQHSNSISLFSKNSPRNPYLFFACMISFVALLIVLFIPPIREFFSLSVLPLKDWLWILILSFSPILLVEIFKGIRKLVKRA